MSCGGCGGGSGGIRPHFQPIPPQPREPPRPATTHRVENGRLVRRRGFLDQQRHRLFVVARNPNLITFRELVALIFFAWCIWRLVSVVSVIRGLATAGSNDACPGVGGMACMRRHWHLIGRMLQTWLGACAAWLPIVVVFVFIAEILGVEYLFS